MSTIVAYEHLMRAADSSGFQVGLEVGPLLKTNPQSSSQEPQPYRELTRLTAKRKGLKIAEHIVAGDLEAAARRLKVRLP